MDTFIVLDTETTGFSRDDRIVEFSFLLFEKDKITDRFSRRCDPGVPINPDASKVHGIFNVDVSGEPPFTKHLPALRNWLDTAIPIVAHSLRFDLRMLLQETPSDFWDFNRPAFCTLEYAKKEHRELRLRKKGHKVSDLAAYFNIDFNEREAHNAEYDAEITGRIVPLLTEGRDCTKPLRHYMTEMKW